MVDAFVCLETPEDFMSVGSYDGDFPQVTDVDVESFLKPPGLAARSTVKPGRRSLSNKASVISPAQFILP
jgi:hypothetical protein